MKKLFMVLGFLTLLLSSLSARYIFDNRLIFSKHATNKDSLFFICIEKAGGVLDSVVKIDSTGIMTWYYTFDITADSTSKIDTTYAPFQTYVSNHAGAGAADSFYVKCTNTCASGWVTCADTIYVDTSGTGNGGSVFDTVTIEGSDDTLDIYFSNDTLFFDSRIGSAYFDLSEFIVLFGSGTMNLDDIQPATNDSSSSQIGTNTNPYGRGDFVDMKAIGYIDFQSTDSVAVSVWNNHPANAPLGTIGLDTTGTTDTLWIKTQDGWGVITFGVP